MADPSQFRVYHLFTLVAVAAVVSLVCRYDFAGGIGLFVAFLIFGLALVVSRAILKR